MKVFVFILLSFAPAFAFAADPVLSCRVSMDQFMASSRMFPLVGDSNQRFELRMKDDGRGGLRGEAEVRFLNDQSDDRTNSLHGAKAVAIYSAGNGLTVSMSILKFADKSDNAASVAVAAVAGLASYEKNLENGAKGLEFGYINPKAADPQLDLWTLVRAGQVQDYELRAVAFKGCNYSVH
jgi:hypothetical protein